jgi:hypothetical protein
MLGVRRSGVTDELHFLEGLRAIKSIRGVVHIRDREALIEIAGGCYGVPEKEYARLMDGAASPRTRQHCTSKARPQPPTVQP